MGGSWGHEYLHVCGHHNGILGMAPSGGAWPNDFGVYATQVQGIEAPVVVAGVVAHWP